MSRRVFHFSEGASDKFWSIETTGSKTLVHFGKTGTAGQAQEKEWPSETAALAAAAKLIAEKTKKGYTEQTAGAAAPVISSAVPAPAPTVKKTTTAATASRKKAATAPASDSPAAAADPQPGADESSAPSISVPSSGQPASPIPTPDLLNPDGILCLERRIDLPEQDWWWAVWRPRRVLPLPEIRPFDRLACLAKLKSIAVAERSWNWRWNLLRLPPRISREEAWFWLKASQLAEAAKPADILKFLETNAPPQEDSALADDRSGRMPIDLKFVCGLSFSGVDHTMQHHGLYSDTFKTGYSYSTGDDSMFRQFILPYLADPEASAMRARFETIVPNLPPVSQHGGNYLPSTAAVAAGLGMPELMRSLVSLIPDKHYQDLQYYYGQQPQELVFGLASTEEVRSEMRRIAAPLMEPSHITAWLACTEYDDLDYIADAIIRETNRERAAQLMSPLLRVHAMEAVPVMFRLILESKVPGTAREWLAQHPAHAVAGAVRLASGRGKIADAALEFLTESAARGQRPLIEAALKTLPPEQATLLTGTIFSAAAVMLPLFDDNTTPDWLKENLPAVKKAAVKIPGNLPGEVLPQVAVGGFAINLPQMNSLLQLLTASTSAEKCPPVFALLKEHATTASLDALVWKLFSAWMSDGAPPKEKWALLALGWLGGDAIALKLAPLIRKWPGESQHQRAVTGLQVLRQIGSDTALMQLNGIAQKLPFKGLKERARELMAEIAQSRGLTKAQLEDRIVPDCGLDERGRRVFDFGPRQFELLLGSDLKPLVRETGDSGKKRPDLPPPNSSDDPALSAEAVADWKLLKKNLREVLKIQTERLEQSMITGRRWSADEFLVLFVNHPLMTHLSRWVIWAVYTPDGRVAATFRVNDDRSLTDSADDPFELPADALTGIVHPLQLDDAVKNAWGQIQGDYEILSPFPQLGRPLFALQPDETAPAADTITRGKGRQVAAGSLFGVFEKSGWIRDSPADGGGYSAHSKPFPAANLTAFAHYDPGLWVGGSMAEMDDQEITEVYFVPGLIGPDWWSHHKNRIPLTQVDPIVLTEVLRDLETILAKAK